jgi:hypothetical protein
MSLSFELYHFPDDTHLLSTSSKVLRGSSLYITGYLCIIDDLLLIRMTQINFIGQIRSTPHKPSNYAWEKKQMDDPSTQTSTTPSPADIAKSLSVKSKKRGKRQETSSLPHQKIPKLSSLSLLQASTDDDTQIEVSSSSLQQSNTENSQQDKIQANISENEQENKMQAPRRTRGRGKKQLT